MTAFGALILLGGRSETIRGLRGDGRDERFRKIDIVNRDKIRRGNFGVEPGVIAPDVTDTNNSNTKFFHRL